MAGLLKYYTKQASVTSMEASFNMDYDDLLLDAENYARRETEAFYSAVFALMFSQPSPVITPDLRVQITELIDDLIQKIYSYTDGLYRPWYTESFGHLGNSSVDQVNTQYGGFASSAASLRSGAIATGILATIEKTLESTSGELAAASVSDIEKKISHLSNRLAITETNSAVGGIIEATAVASFGTSLLFKRWIAVGDERVRHTHRIAASKKPIPVTQLYLVGDTFMRYPADNQAFGGNVAGEIINCRCRSLVLPKTFTQPNSFSLNSFLVGNTL